MRALIATLLPDPVVPAISRWGIPRRSSTMGSPWMSLPRASVRRDGDDWKRSDSTTSRREMISPPPGFGTSMPTLERPGSRSMRIDSADSESARSSESPMTWLTLIPAAGRNSYVVTTGPRHLAQKRPGVVGREGDVLERDPPFPFCLLQMLGDDRAPQAFPGAIVAAARPTQTGLRQERDELDAQAEEDVREGDLRRERDRDQDEGQDEKDRARRAEPGPRRVRDRTADDAAGLTVLTGDRAAAERERQERRNRQKEEDQAHRLRSAIFERARCEPADPPESQDDRHRPGGEAERLVKR